MSSRLKFLAALMLSTLGMACCTPIDSNVIPRDPPLTGIGSSSTPEDNLSSILSRPEVPINRFWAQAPIKKQVAEPCELAQPLATVIPMVDALFIAWDPVEHADGYIVYRVKTADPSDHVALGVGPNNASGYFDPNPRDGYSYLVQPFRGNVGSDLVSGTPLKRPPEPLPLPDQVTSIGASRTNGGPQARIDVGWSAARGAAGYTAQIAFLTPTGWVIWDQKDVGLTLKARFFAPNQQHVLVRVAPFNADHRYGQATEWLKPAGDEPLPR